MNKCIKCDLEAVKKSHIIPDFFYKWVKDGNVVQEYGPDLKPSSKPFQSGYWESLLCKRHEAHENTKFEQPCHKLFNSISEYKPTDGQVIEIEIPGQLLGLVGCIIYRACHSKNSMWNSVGDELPSDLIAELGTEKFSRLKIIPKIICLNGSVINGLIHTPYVIKTDVSIMGKVLKMAFGGMEFMMQLSIARYEFDVDCLGDKTKVMKINCGSIVV